MREILEESLWYCVRTQPKREHIASQHLAKLESVEVFCPRIRYRKATRRGKVWWTEPLFPGYILARFSRKEMERAVTYSQGVIGLVRFGSQIPCIDERFINNLRNEVSRLSEHDDEMLTLAPELKVGDEVEVVEGPFRGMKGTVETLAPAQERVAVLLEFLGQVQPVDLDLFAILLPKKPTPKLS